jgi:hypothetical protein
MFVSKLTGGQHVHHMHEQLLGKSSKYQKLRGKAR